ncbi:MAG TPA: hypothetical protein VIV09_17060 [Pseudolabrys sp.]
MDKPRKHLVIPDTQIKPGVPIDHIDWISKYAVEKTPDVIVIIGDWADMPSLSSYDVGTKSFEGRTYRADILAANDAPQRLMAPIQVEVARREKAHRPRWNPRKIVTLGNHENRIPRAVEMDRKIDGLISEKDIFFEQWGFEVYPFLQPVVVDGVAYCHYFVSGQMGRPVTSARMLLQKHHMSCFAGHQQGRDIAYAKRADGSRITGIIAGSCYLHDEPYLNAQSNEVWRGVYMLHEVNNGSFDEMPVSLTFLKEKYGQ